MRRQNITGGVQWTHSKNVCDYLGLSYETIQKYVKTNKIPYYKVGRKLFFDLQEIDRWVKNHKGVSNVR